LARHLTSVKAQLPRPPKTPFSHTPLSGGRHSLAPQDHRPAHRICLIPIDRLPREWPGSSSNRHTSNSNKVISLILIANATTVAVKIPL